MQTGPGSQVLSLLSMAGAQNSDLPSECLGDDDFGAEIKALVAECLISSNVPTNATCLERVFEMARRKWSVLHQFYAAYCVGIVSHRNMKPNKAVTLYGPTADTDAVYPGNTGIPLTPRVGNAVQGAFTFNNQMMFFQMITGQVDIDAGWRFVGGTVLFQGDPVSGMAQDTSFDVFGERAAGLDSPLQTYMYRLPDSTVQFTASAMHNNATPTALKEGATLLILDTNCRNAVRNFRDSLFEMEFGSAVAELIRLHRSACRRGPGLPTASPTAPTGPRLL